MPGVVIDLEQARLERSPHLAMPAVCLGCRHEWVVVAPVGTTDLDCPSCQTARGVAKGLVGADEHDAVFRCVCGSEALTAILKPSGALRLRCMRCGTDQHDAVFG